MKIIFLTIIFFVLQISAFGQVNVERKIKNYSCSCENEKSVREYFEQFENQRKFIEGCERESENRRKSLNLPKPIKVSGFGPSPVSIVKPYYPKVAKQLGVSGEVLVEVFTDEKGFVVYSNILKGNAFLRESVRKAACLSRFTLIFYCGKPIKARWLIKYNFISS
ncbi:MAG: energy transducer TonB [Pyrinomonadaceae bacterium]